MNHELGKLKIIFIFAIFLAVLLLPKISWAADYFITQDASGNDTGADCANAHSAVWFNTLGNWIKPKQSGKIGPGDIVHLCGTFNFPANSPGLIVQMGGYVGSPIIILFEENAVLQSPQFTNGFEINAYKTQPFTYSSDHSPGNLIIDGGVNGTIQNTANGTGLAYHAASTGMSLSGWSDYGGWTLTNVEVKNLTIKDIYKNLGADAGSTDIDGRGTVDIKISGQLKNISIHDSTFSNARSGISGSFDGSTWDSIDIYNNYINDHAWGMTIAGLNILSTATNVKIHNNEVTDWWNWQCPAIARFCSGGLSAWNSGTTYSTGNKVSYGGAPWVSLQDNNLNHTPANGAWWMGGDMYHTDGIITWSGNNSGTPVYAPLIYNNYFHGHLGRGSATGFIYCTVGNPIANEVSGSECILFNNLLIGESGGAGRLWFGGNTKNNKAYNNVIVGIDSNPSSTFNPCIISSSLGGDIYKNNICINFSQVFATQWANNPAAIISAMDNNIFYNFNTPDPNRLYFGNGYAYSLAQWRALGRDVNSITTNPLLDGSYKPTVGSSAINAGVDLSSVGITALNSDKAGVTRPQGPAWDIGAYEYVGAAPPPDTTPPQAPTGVVVQ